MSKASHENPDPMILFKLAFDGNDSSRLRILLTNHPELKARINEPVSAFDAPPIIHVRSREMLDVLLEAGADINAKSRWWAGGFGILHGAAPELAKYAIQRGATIDVHAASRLGMLDKLRELVMAAPELVHARGGDGQTALHFASTVQIAEFLVAHGADIDARDVDHESTPAQWMIRDRQDIVRYLIGRGCHTDILMASALGDTKLVCRHLDADPDCIRVRVHHEFFPMKNPKAGGTIYQWTLGNFFSPHDVARRFGHEDVFELLMERSPADVKFIAACWNNDQATAKRVIEENPELSDVHHHQVPHAARNNNLAAVRLMLACGLSVSAVGQHGATPLHWASFHGNVEMIQEILRHQPPLEAKDADFNATPLGWAIYGSENGWHSQTGDYAASVDALLKAGAKAPAEAGGTEPVRKVLAAQKTAR